MAKNKKSFILYVDLIHTIEKLSDDQSGKLIKHILRYVNDLNPKLNDSLLEIVFEPIKQQLKRDLIDWERRIAAKSEGGRKSMLKRWGGIESDSNPIIDKLVKDTQSKVTDNVNVTVTVNDTVSETINMNLIDKYFVDLANSQTIEIIAMLQKVPKEIVIAYIPTFKAKAELSYPTYQKFVNHFKNAFALSLKASKTSKVDSLLDIAAEQQTALKSKYKGK